MEYYLGLDVGGTNLVAGVVNSEGKIVAKAAQPTDAWRSIEEITDDMALVSMRAVVNSGIDMRNIKKWGIGMPSCVNKKTNLLVHANCFGWHNVPIYNHLSYKLPFPLTIENDANCAALGEARAGAARNYRNAIMLTLGTGVGSGIIIDGQLYTGADGMGAELGHTKLVYDGELCTCGQRGCLEAYCSSTAILRETKKLMGQPLDGERLFKAAREGNTTALQIKNDYIRHLAAGISTFITIFRPEVIILGGGISHAGEELFKPLNDVLRESTFGGAEIGVPPVIPAQLGNDAGIIGAAFL